MTNFGIVSTAMLAPYAQKLSTMRIVLASASPRRREILTPLLPSLEVVPSTFEEDIDKSTVSSAADYVERTALGKGTEVWGRCQEEVTNGRPLLVISADTVVVGPGGAILEKPPDAAAATAMLKSLSGTEHSVLTGVVLFAGESGPGEPRVARFSERTTVTFSELSDTTIASYVRSGEPFDKAGGYGIQGTAGSFVTGVSGCYFNVVGFPQNRFCRECAALLDESAV